MKKLYLPFILTLICSAFTNAQITYSDDFEGFNSSGSNSGYNVSLENSNLKAVGTGSAAAYQPIAYNIHNNGSLTTVNMSSNTKLYIKAKATGAAVLRVDIKDSQEYITNFSAKTERLSADYEVYVLDYSGAFQDGGYGGSPCTSATSPCPVDASKIAKVFFYVNADAGAYSGTLEIDWISVGAPVEEAEPEPFTKIRYNQVGYHLEREKLINITAENSFAAQPYTVTSANGTVVASGNSTASQLWDQSGEHVGVIDVTNINTIGVYTLNVADNEIEFKVNANSYETLSEAAFKYYYFNRASTAITPEFGGVFARPNGLVDTQIYIHSSAASSTRPTGSTISAPKGWYDAGDYNKYIVNSGISTYTLLAAFEHYPEYLKTKQYDIPEVTSGIPDVLDEIKWNLDWMLDMQDPSDGGVYHKLTGLNFQGIIMPDAYTARRYVVQKSTAAALNFAAVTAMASRIYAEYNTQLPGYSARLIQASKDAYAWAKANPTDYYNQPRDVKTGEYGDRNVSDEFQWAAVELLITTGENQYERDVNVNNIQNGIPTWNASAPLALISIISHANELAGRVNVNDAKTKFLRTADGLKNKINNSPMRVAMGRNDFVWGSNGHASNQLMVLLAAYNIDLEEDYLNAAYTASDYLLGRNATGYCFVSGFGDQPMQNPHHRISEADDVVDPVPGMLAGGPQPGQEDSCSGFPSSQPARSYVDTWCSYSSNEVTINWNAPLFYSTVALSTIAAKTTLSNSSVELNKDLTTFSVYPNPSNVFVNIKLANATNLEVKIYSLDGKLILKQDHNTSRSLNVSSLSKGIYFISTVNEGKNYVTKFIKN